MTQKILGLKRRVAQRKYLTRVCFGNTVQLQHFTSVLFFPKQTQSLVQESGQTHSRVRLVMVPRYLKKVLVSLNYWTVYTRAAWDSILKLKQVTHTNITYVIIVHDHG